VGVGLGVLGVPEGLGWGGGVAHRITSGGNRVQHKEVLCILPRLQVSERLVVPQGHGTQDLKTRKMRRRCFKSSKPRLEALHSETSDWFWRRARQRGGG